MALVSRLKPPMVEQLNASFNHPAFAYHPQPLTLSVGTISDGDWPSNVPLECRFTCRMSFPIGWSFQQVQSFIDTHLVRACSVDPWLVENIPSVRYPGFRALGWAIDDNIEKVRSTLIPALAECHQITTGKPLGQGAFLGTADGRYFSVTEGAQAVYYGPTGENMHAPDEYVELDSVLQAARVLARMIVTWCG